LCLTRNSATISLMKTDKRVDAYIANAEPFAQPILKHLRGIVQAACPEVEETIKWGMPAFDYRGEMICSMASFKKHVSFGFWKESLIKGIKDAAKNKEEAMGSLGRIESMADLPSDAVLKKFIKEAMQLNEQGIKVKKVVKPADRTLEIPQDFTQALKRNRKAEETFENFSYSNKKEYIEWITSAKTDDTREKRLATAIEWLSEGKPRMWKYQK
jgi:uncharacterized protein YdeI (YjbR/CyaY-like superfamily)